ncbi:MAG: S24 family peptidase [Pseudomonadota bacterium]
MQIGGWRIVKVCGESMSPLIAPDSFCVFRKTKQLRAGDVVLVDHPQFGRIVKSVRRVENGNVWLAGLSELSTAATALGAIPFEAVLGRLVLKISPPERSVYG